MMSEMLLAPIIIFLVIVAPIWIIMHYRTIGRKQTGMNKDDYQRLDELDQIADKMEQRISTLESILDNETPDWRKKYEQ